MVAIGAAILGGSAIQGGSSLAGTGLQYALQKKLMDHQMSWQEAMASTSYQRAVADLHKAGLNPMLAYMQGGAATPGGAGGSVSAPHTGVDPMSTALQYKTARNLDQELRNKRVEETQRWASAEVDAQHAELLKWQQKGAQLQNEGQELSNKYSRLGIPYAQNEAEIASGRFGTAMQYLRKVPGIDWLVPGTAMGVGGGVLRANSSAKAAAKATDSYNRLGRP